MINRVLIPAPGLMLAFSVICGCSLSNTNPSPELRRWRKTDPDIVVTEATGSPSIPKLFDAASALSHQLARAHGRDAQQKVRRAYLRFLSELTTHPPSQRLPPPDVTDYRMAYAHALGQLTTMMQSEVSETFNADMLLLSTIYLARPTSSSPYLTTWEEEWLAARTVAERMYGGTITSEIMEKYESWLSNQAP